MSDNTNLWDSVCVTDPETTKKVSQRGGFTAICAQSQFKEATKHFGPFGIKWHLSDERFAFLDHGMCLYQANLHIRGSCSSICSSIQWAKGDRPDVDFAKKVSTDAITKALSRLGYNSDVFEGKFDDNKYVAKLKEEKQKEATEDAMTKKAKFFRSVSSLLEGKAPKDGDEWRAYIKLLCNGVNEKIVTVDTIDDNSELWDKITEEAVRQCVADV